MGNYSMKGDQIVAKYPEFCAMTSDNKLSNAQI